VLLLLNLFIPSCISRLHRRRTAEPLTVLKLAQIGPNRFRLHTCGLGDRILTGVELWFGQDSSSGHRTGTPSMARQEDPERGSLEEELEKISPTDSESSIRTPNAHAALPEPADVKAATRHEPHEVIDDNEHRRGRSHSVETHDSQDTARTHSDDEGHDAQVATPHRSRSRAPHRSLSRAQSSTRSVRRDPIVVPRKERRGLFGTVCTIAEVTEPYDYSRRRKWTITFVVAVAAAAAPMGSSIILPALADISRTFDSTPTVVNLGVAMYMLSMSIFPLWWSSFSETLGRRTIYISSFALFLVFNILAAVSTSIGMFIVTRLLSGGAAASVQAVGAGTIADIWEVKERGKAMGYFYLGPLMGPLIAPILGGILAQYLGWRSNQWALAIFGALVLIFIIFCLPETLRARKPLAAIAEAEAEARVASDAGNAEKGIAGNGRPGMVRTNTTQSVKIQSVKYIAMLRRAFLDPLKIILYLRFPAVAICVAYASITFGSLYVLNISVQDVFAKPPYNYSTIIIGLLYIPNSAGYVCASMFGGRWVDKIMHREARKSGRYDEKGRLKFIPEDRMKENAWIGALLFPSALIMYGFTAGYGVNIAAPMIANFFFGVGLSSTSGPPVLLRMLTWLADRFHAYLCSYHDDVD
jgi:multidrug resistance protein